MTSGYLKRSCGIRTRVCGRWCHCSMAQVHDWNNNNHRYNSEYSRLFVLRVRVRAYVCVRLNDTRCPVLVRNNIIINNSFELITAHNNKCEIVKIYMTTTWNNEWCFFPRQNIYVNHYKMISAVNARSFAVIVVLQNP